jgi:ABC-type glycerol-3-phosphate transport system permease component
MGMEDETRGFLVLILNTISIVLLWMLTSMFFGIYLGYGFFETTIGWKNIVFYVLLLVTLFFLIRHLRRKWKL